MPAALYGVCFPRDAIHDFRQTPEAPNVPRLAATLAAILLIASSIGINVARYPRVGRTIDPAPAAAAESASPSQTADEAPRAEKRVDRDESPVRPQVADPAAREARPVVADGEPTADRMVAVTPQTMPAQIDKSVPIVDVRPMVSASDTQTSCTDSPANAKRFQRLPPVESNGQFSLESGVADDGAGYPATATP